MKSLERLIVDNLISCPEWAEYNDVILDFIRSHTQKRPDMCIEGCKSLVEGISKLIYFNLDIDNQNVSEWKNLSLVSKLDRCIQALKLENHEREFIDKNKSLVHKLGEIRNDRGDISHGKLYPKDSYSDVNFAKFITLWTEGLCYFLLSMYIARKQREEEIGITIYTEKQFEEFDNYLDTLYPEIDISYSKALKEQDSLKYELLMDDFIINNYE